MSNSTPEVKGMKSNVEIVRSKAKGPKLCKMLSERVKQLQLPFLSNKFSSYIVLIMYHKDTTQMVPVFNARSVKLST